MVIIIIIIIITIIIIIIIIIIITNTPNSPGETVSMILTWRGLPEIDFLLQEDLLKFNIAVKNTWSSPEKLLTRYLPEGDICWAATEGVYVVRSYREVTGGVNNSTSLVS